MTDTATDQTLPAVKAFLVSLHPALGHREYVLTEEDCIIGREAAQCTIAVSGQTVSRRHARIYLDTSGNFRLEDLKATNGVYVNGQKITGTVGLSEGDVIGLGSQRIDHLRFQRDCAPNQPWTKILESAKEWTIGRAPQNHVALPFETAVSSIHAIVRPTSKGVEIRDQNSLNGTWVNGRHVSKALLSPTDAVMVGATLLRFELVEGARLKVVQRDPGAGIGLECIGLTRTVSSGGLSKSTKTILDHVSLAIRPGEFVGLLGPSGAGKSTLLKSLNGYNPPNYGQILLNEAPLFYSFEMFRNTIGYVPQDDIVHPELTVEQSLNFVAKLRLPADVTKEQREDLINTTIDSLGLSHVRTSSIHELSGGQRKRVSIGCELITRPGVLFLDEPTSGMDPSTEERLMLLFRDMARHGTTILITTHILYNLDMLDKVVIMSRGKLVFFGTPKEAMGFFTINGKAVERPTQIFDLLEGEVDDRTVREMADPKMGVATLYEKKYRESPLFQQYVAGALSDVGTTMLQISGVKTPRATSTPSGDPRQYLQMLERPTGKKGFRLDFDVFGPRAMSTLTVRNFIIKLVSMKRALSYLLVPLILALVTLTLRTNPLPDDAQRLADQEAIAQQINGGPIPMEDAIKALLVEDPETETRSAEAIVSELRFEGLMNLPVDISVLLMFVMTAIFMGTLMACLDISTERSIYLRERMANQRIADYIGSKLPFLFSLTAVQCGFFLAICYAKPGLRIIDFPAAFLALVAMAWAAVAIGLFLSAIDPTQGQFSVIFAIVAVLPQLVLSGGLAPDYFAGMPGYMQYIAQLLPARWGLEMLMTASFNQPDHRALDWVPEFVPDTIGFSFGNGVYLKCTIVLCAQALVWLVCCAWVLKRQDRVT